MGLQHLSWIIPFIVIWQHVYGQSCDLQRADRCTEEFENILNDVLDMNEHRTLESKVRLCTLSLRSKTDMTSTNISSCFQLSTVLCDESDADLQAARARWENVTSAVDNFCENDCSHYTEVTRCKNQVNITAITTGKPSKFCSTYETSRGTCLEDTFSLCNYMEELFDGLFDSSYFKKYHQNICQSGCSSLDQTVEILQTCYSYIETLDPADLCLAHRNFDACVRSNTPCDEFATLIPFLFGYDYHGNQSLCQDEACRKAGNCKSELQRQYDSTLGYYIVQSEETTHLRDLCLIPISENDHKNCYNEYINNCTNSTTHPIRAQWSELIRDIYQLCDTDCEGVITKVPECHSLIEYDALDNRKWSTFCRSHTSAQTCARGQNCSLALTMLDRLLKPEVTGLVETVCSSGCSKLHKLLEGMETCYTHLDEAPVTCGHYNKFTRCIHKEADDCSDRDAIINFLFPGFTDLRTSCTTTTSTTTSTTTTTTTTTATPTTTTPTTTTTQPTTTPFTVSSTSTSSSTLTTTLGTTPSTTTEKTTIDVSQCFTHRLYESINNTNVDSHTTTGEESSLCIEVVKLASCLISECPSLEHLSRCIASLPPEIHQLIDGTLPSCKSKIQKVQQEMSDFLTTRRKSESNVKKFFDITCTKETSASPGLISHTMTSVFAVVTSSFLLKTNFL